MYISVLITALPIYRRMLRFCYVLNKASIMYLHKKCRSNMVYNYIILMFYDSIILQFVYYCAVVLFCIVKWLHYYNTILPLIILKNFTVKSLYKITYKKCLLIN